MTLSILQAGNTLLNDYLKVIVEVFRAIEAECTGLLTAH
jgi:hypothetical protein